MELQPYDWVSYDHNSRSSLRVWCHKRNSSEKVLLVIKDCLPSLIVEVPRHVENQIPVIEDWLNSRLSSSCHSPVRVEHFTWKRLYYYNEEPNSLCLKFYFESEEARRHARNLILYGANLGPDKRILQNYITISEDLVNIKFTIHESDISTVTRFLVENNLTFCQWIRIPEISPVEEMHKLSLVEEYHISKEDIQPIPDDESLGWKTYPTVMGFDIEVCPKDKRRFPNASEPYDYMYMISLVVSDIGSGKPQKNILITTQPCSHVNNCEVIKVKDEKEMGDEFVRQVKKYNPAVLSGYNIFGFDIKYMTIRFDTDKDTGRLDAWDSRDISLMKNGKTRYYESKRTLNSGREFSFSLLLAEGRHFIDMHAIALQNYPFLQDFRLDTVAKTFLGRGKNPVTVEEMFEAYERECPDRMAEVAEYCIVDSAVCIDLMEKLHTWTNLTETSNIVNVGITDIFLKGQQIRVLNMVFAWAYKNKFIVDKITEEKTKFQGAHVVVPKPGLHENVIILDFASLYPSIIIAYNICHTTFIPNPDKFPKDSYNVFEWKHEGTTHKHHFVKKEIFKGIIPSIAEHLLTERRKVKKQMVTMCDNSFEYNILDAKQNGLKISANSIYGMYGTGSTGKLPLVQGGEVITHVGRKLIKDSLRYSVDKFNAEIVYGDTDSIMINMKLDDPEQKSFVLEKLQLEDNYPNSGLLHIAVGKAFEDNICSTFVKPLRLEFEGVARYLLSLKKKKYAKLMLDNKTGLPETEFGPDGKETMKLDIKGLPCIQKGTCTWARNQYMDTLKAIIGGKSLEEVKAVVKGYVDDLLAGKVKDEDLILAGVMGSSYKETSNSSNKIFSQNMANKGHSIAGGNHYRYVIVEGKTKRKGDNMRLYEEIYLKGEEKIDRIYYITNVAGTSIDSLLFHSFYSTDKTGEFSDICECGEKSTIINSPCGHLCFCSQCYLLLEGWHFTCTCGNVMWYKATGTKCDSCGVRLKKRPIGCRLCDRNLLMHYSRFNLGEESFDTRASKYKFMRNMR